jgi:hypothetical protein
VKHGVFATSEEAVAACRSIVDGYLTDAFKPGMTADALFQSYTAFGEDPFIVRERARQVLRLGLRPPAVLGDRGRLIRCRPA